MKFFVCLGFAILFLAPVPAAFAAAAPASAAPPAPSAAAAPAPAPAPAAASPAKFSLDDYINELVTAVGLSDEEKKAIVSFYQADDVPLKNILNSQATSPLDQDRQVNALRKARVAKIEELLGSTKRIADFLKVESKYRVALLELDMQPAAAPAPAAPPAPAPAPAAPTPASAKNPPPE